MDDPLKKCRSELFGYNGMRQLSEESGRKARVLSCFTNTVFTGDVTKNPQSAIGCQSVVESARTGQSVF